MTLFLDEEAMQETANTVAALLRKEATPAEISIFLTNIHAVPLRLQAQITHHVIRFGKHAEVVLNYAQVFLEQRR